jgi:hypothetical protein
MAIPFVAPVDLLKNELQNARVQNLASAPSSPVEGQIYHNTTDHSFYFYDGSAWNRVNTAYLLARATHTGTQTASTISDFDTQVRTSRLDQMAAPTADVSLNSHKITNLTDPTSAQDAATKAYADSLASGLSFKSPVRAVSTSNITLSGAQTIDGVSIIAGDRVLVAGQTTGANNGIYVAAAGAWARSTDADTSAEVKAGTALFVDEGTTYGDTQWVLTTNDAITLGTTSLTFTQFGGGTTYTADETSLHLTGTQFSIKSTYVLPVAQGGTNATTAAAARTSLSAATVFAATIGDGSATSFNVDHSFNTRDVIVQVYQAATPWAQVFADVTLSTVNRAVVAFATAPATNAYRVVVQGLG